MAAVMQLGASFALPEGTYALKDIPGAARRMRRLPDGLLRVPTVSDRRAAAPASSFAQGASRTAIVAKAQAIWFARELINLPANDLGPSDLAEALAGMGKAYGAEVSAISGEALLKQNFPHHFRRGPDQRPRAVPCRSQLG